MGSGFWVQERLDDTLLFTHCSVSTEYGYLPWTVPRTPLMMPSVPPPWMQDSVPTLRRTSSSNAFHRPPYRYEVPPRMRSQRARNARSPSPTAAASFDSDDTVQQNQQNFIERIGSGLSQDCISDFLHSNLGRLTITEEDIICTICQDEIYVEEETSTLSCGHIYHSSCIKKWLLIKNECAVCRASAI